MQVMGQKAYCDKMRELSGALDANTELPDYLEATVFSKDKAVIMVGNFADCDTPEKKKKINHVTRFDNFIDIGLAEFLCTSTSHKKRWPGQDISVLDNVIH